MIKSKKSQMNAVVIMSLIIIAAIIILIVGQKIVEKYSSGGTLEVCRTSVLSQATLRPGGVSPLSLNCQRRYINVYSDHIEFGNEPDKTKTISVVVNGDDRESFSDLSNDILNQVIAKEMKTCWYEFDEGRTDVFPNNMPFTGFAPDPDDEVCFICTQMTFDNSVKNKKFNGLLKYLKETYVPDKKYTYNEYFNAPSLSKMSWNEFTEEELFDYFEKTPDEDIVIDASKDLSIVFYKEYDTSRLNELGKTIVGVTGVEVGSDKTDIYYVFVIPTDKIEDACEIQAS